MIDGRNTVILLGGPSLLHAIEFEANGIGETECGLMFIPDAQHPKVYMRCCEACAEAIENRESE